MRRVAAKQGREDELAVVAEFALLIRPALSLLLAHPARLRHELYRRWPVSVEAISWALNQAPVPTAWTAVERVQVRFVGLANHAGPDGTAAFPSVAAFVRYTGLSERTVRSCLDRL